MPRGGYRKGSGQKRKNLYRVSVGVTQEMADKALTNAGSIAEAALLGAELKGDLNALQAYADERHGGDLAKALGVLISKCEGE